MIERRTRTVLMILLLARMGCGIAHSQQYAIKTNMLYDVLLTPDIGFELVTGEHSSVGLSVFGHWKPYGINSKMITVQPEYRYWFNGRPLVREFIGATAFVSAYDINVNRHLYAGTAGLIGMTGGYVFPIGKKSNLELSGGFGFLFFKQKQYVSDDGGTAGQEVNSYGYKLFPAKLSVTFIYIIK